MKTEDRRASRAGSPVDVAIVAREDEARPALIERARTFARPRLEAALRADGENAFDHAQGVASILEEAGSPEALQAAAYVAACAEHDETLAGAAIADAFGAAVQSLVDGTRQLARLEGTARAAGAAPALVDEATQTERVRRMLLAFSRDLRGVLLHLASRLQTMRWHAQRGLAYPAAQAREALERLAPLANRLGVWSMKWELEDLAFRFAQPQAYLEVTRLVDARRAVRLREVERFRQQVTMLLADAGLAAQVQGRAKHLYSIWRKMQGKHLAFENVFDLRALRVIVATVGDCYAALARLQARWRAVDGEFDDYIVRPKANGYQSLHTVVLDDDGRAVEVQIRTQAMNDHAEQGIAAHWAYKEAGARGYAGVSAAAHDAARVAQARKAMLQQLLDWERDLAAGDAAPASDDRVYVFTPQGAVIDLPHGATAIDFAYAVHTSLGHRCRGAKLDGALVPLNTPLRNGQTVEVTTTKEGGPSLDWLNPELGFLASPRSRAKVRAWFNTQAQAHTLAQGRERLEKILQRLGKTAAKHADIATRLGLEGSEALYLKLGKDEQPLRDIELLWTEVPAAPSDDDAQEAPASLQPSRRDATDAAPRRGDVLVVGVDSLLTGLARCCRPAPPDAIGGFVTRHKGVAIHRASCVNFRHMAERSPPRVIAVAWGASSQGDAGARFAVDVNVEAQDRPGLLRDVGDVFAKERINVTGVQSHTAADRVAWMTFTIEVPGAGSLAPLLAQVARVPGVRTARRK